MPDLCPNKKLCGSCGWSHIPYAKQLNQKLSDINGSLKIKHLDERASEIIPSPKTEHYRNRMDFVIDFEGKVGLREKGKWWRVIDNHKCFLAEETIDELFDIVRTWVKESGLSFYDRKANIGLLRYAVIRSTTIGEAMIIIVTSAPEKEERNNLREKLCSLAYSVSISMPAVSVIHSINSTISDVSLGDKLETISGNGYIEEMINGLRFRITPNAFFQTNPYGAAILMDTVREFAGDFSKKTVLDLYCGSGFFSIALASCSTTNRQRENITLAKIIGVELVPEAIRDARINAELNGTDVEFYEAKMEDFDWSKYKADVVILDPPRSGMHDKMLESVLNVRPETIVYVSCNYKNFARELVRLREFYSVETMRAIDMFPHTPHVELISKLVRTSSTS